MLIKKPADIPSSAITANNPFLNRRQFLAGVAVPATAAATSLGLRERASPPLIAQAKSKIDGIQKSKFSMSEVITPYGNVTNYNNYYEFATDKYGPAGLAEDFKTWPWALSIERLLTKQFRTSPCNTNVLPFAPMLAEANITPMLTHLLDQQRPGRNFS